MTSLYIRAFIASSISMKDNGHADEHAWRTIAWSDSVPLVDSLRYGERQSIPSQVFRVPVGYRELPENAWVGFAVTGDAMIPRATKASERIIRGGVRVYVCDPKTLLGAADPSRAARLRDAYTAAC